MAAVGEMGIVLEKLKNMLAANVAFAAQCALDGLTPADQVYLHANRPEMVGGQVRPDDIDRPFIIIAPDEFTYNEHSEGCMLPTMTIVMHLNDKYRGNTFHETAENFTNFVSQVLEELSQQNRQPASLVMRKISQVTRPQPVARRDENDGYKFWFAEYSIQLGAEVSPMS